MSTTATLINDIKVATAEFMNGKPLNAFSFNDGTYDASNSGKFIVSGTPKAISMDISMSAVSLPQFAVGKDSIAPDMPSMDQLQPPPTETLTSWLPSNPSRLSDLNAYFGSVQDNSVKFATNGIYVVACGGYLQTNANIAQPMAVPTGTHYTFALLTNAGTGGGVGEVQSGICNWDTSTILGPNSYNVLLGTLQTTGPLIRNPSTLLISEDYGQSFNLCLSEYSKTNNVPNLSFNNQNLPTEVLTN